MPFCAFLMPCFVGVFLLHVLLSSLLSGEKVLAIGPSYPITHCDLAAVRGLGIGGFYEVVSALQRRLCDFVHATWARQNN